MAHPLEAGTIRIIKIDGSTAGTGFLVSSRLAVTCAHVIKAAWSGPGQEVGVEYHLKDPTTNEKKAGKAVVLEAGWHPGNDLAVLELKQPPPRWVKPLVLQGSGGIEGSKFLGLGYADDEPIRGRWVEGTTQGRVDVRNYEDPVLQLNGEFVDQGLSGCAIVEPNSRRVIAVLGAYRDLGRSLTGPPLRIAYAIPTESIWKAYSRTQEEPEQKRPFAPLLEGIDQLPYDYARLIQRFLTDYLGTPDHPEPFGGRDESFRLLNNWLASGPQRLLIAAPAGSGKSALLVRWIDSLLAHEDLAIVFVPISIRYRTNLANAFLASLAARLAYLHEDAVPTSAETSTAVYQDLVDHYLTTPLTSGKKLLVVVDGFDESADWDTALHLFPQDLHRDVRVAVSARFVAGDTGSQPWLRRLGWERTGWAEVTELAPLDRDGVADVLKRTGFPVSELSQHVDIVSKLHLLTEGDPLLVHLYVDDLWARGEDAARLQPEDLENIKPGLEGYFERWWEDQKKLWGEYRINREHNTKLVFNLLCAAFGPLSAANLVFLAEEVLDTYQIEEALETLKRFVIGVPDQRTDTIGYVLAHPKLRDYFWERLTGKEQRDLETRFLSWGEQTLNDLINKRIDARDSKQISPYIIQYYSEHLNRSDQGVEKYFLLMHHQEWAQAWYTVEGAFGGYLKDVHRVREVCSKLALSLNKEGTRTTYLGELIRCGLIEASLRSLAENIPPELIAILKRDKVWTLPQVLAFVRQMPSAEQQSATLSALPDYTDDHELPEVLDAARAIQEEWPRAQALATLVERLPVEQLGQVLEVARAIQDEELRAQALAALAERLPVEQLGQVLEVVRAIQHKGRRARALAALAERLPEITQEALDAARTIQDEELRVQALAALVERLPEITQEHWMRRERSRMKSCVRVC
jgi:hypothetical protein